VAHSFLVIDTLQIYQDLAESLGEAAARKLAAALGTIYRELQQTVTKEDFQDLRKTVSDLAEAQKRTETRLEELAEAQKRTEARVEELAEAQKRTEARLGELAMAQTKTEFELQKFAREMHAGFRDINNRFGVLGSRWGDGAEETFRRGLLETVGDLGYTVEHYRGEDPDGFINYSPRSFDLDVLLHDSETVVAEIKSNASGADVTEFYRAVLLFEKQTGRSATKRILVAVTLQQAALERAKTLGIIVATSFDPLTDDRG
jgi:hypothetical protein